MKQILVVLGSVRVPRVADDVAELVMATIQSHQEVTATIVDFAALPLPFLDSPVSPASAEFAPTDPNVLEWTRMVSAADGIVFITPEYNHAMTAVQKNAIDWIKKEWEGKPVALVAYGWGGGEYSIVDARRVLEYLQTKVGESVTQLYFTKQLAPDGTILDPDAAGAQVRATIDELIAALSSQPNG